MPAALRIDTLKFVRKLTEAGMDRGHAEAIVEGLNEADSSDLATRADIARLEATIAGLATTTKADIAGLEATTRAEISRLEAGLADVKATTKTNIAELEARLYKHLWLLGAGIVGLTVALVRLLP
ncbi:hypothetical protein BH23PSE1_BH23PSE1_19300 [soil metagenome]